MKMMKKDVVMTVGYFPKKIYCDLNKTLRITLEGILYSRGVKVGKFQLVSKKKLNWCLMLKYTEIYLPQRQ